MKVCYLFLTLIVWLNFSCKKDDQVISDDLECPVTAKQGSKNKIAGKWRLVKGQNSFTPTPTSPEDYSCHHIIYHFKSNGTLVVTSDLEDYIGNAVGSINYQFKSGILKIGNGEQDIKISATQLEINDGRLDGPILKLIRME